MILSTIALGGCCNQIFCRDGVRITMLPASGTFPLGEYVFSVRTPTSRYEVRCTREENRSVCGDTGPHPEGQGEPFVWIDDDRASLEVTGTPSTVTISVAIDGASRGEETFTPTYTTARPNGAHCDPECRGSIVEMTVP
jgi:hypothetical protein